MDLTSFDRSIALYALFSFLALPQKRNKKRPGKKMLPRTCQRTPAFLPSLRTSCSEFYSVVLNLCAEFELGLLGKQKKSG
jgi:hypothetical protein